MKMLTWIKSLTLSALILLGLFSSVAFAELSCTQAQMDNSECVILNFEGTPRYKIEVVKGQFGEFPVINGEGNSVFKYKVSSASNKDLRGLGISHVDVQIPVCPNKPALKVLSPSGSLIDVDPSSGFSVPGSKIFKFESFDLKPNSMDTFMLTLQGIVAAQPGVIAFKAGNELLQPDEGKFILIPSCAEPKITAAKTCDVEPTIQSDGVTIGYQFNLKITNAGDLPLKYITVRETAGDGVCQITKVNGASVYPTDLPVGTDVSVPDLDVLNPDQMANVTIACTTAGVNGFDNTALVKAVATNSTNVQDTAQVSIDDPEGVCKVVPNPNLKLVKDCGPVRLMGMNGVLAVDIPYSITVTNMGNVKLSDVHVQDNIAGLDESISMLAPGESKTYEGSYMPSAPTNADASKLGDEKYAAHQYGDVVGALFTNSAVATATPAIANGGVATAMDSCSVPICPMAQCH